MCDFGKGCYFINIPKGVKTEIGLKHITPVYTSNFSTVSNPFRDESQSELPGPIKILIRKLGEEFRYCRQKVGDSWRIKNHVSLEMHVMYESYVVGCCLLCA